MNLRGNVQDLYKENDKKNFTYGHKRSPKHVARYTLYLNEEILIL